MRDIIIAGYMKNNNIYIYYKKMDDEDLSQKVVIPSRVVEPEGTVLRNKQEIQEKLAKEVAKKKQKKKICV